MYLMDSMGPVIILAFLAIGIVFLTIGAIKKKGARKSLRQKGFRMDHFWSFYGDYIALDLDGNRVAIKGGIPKRSASGEGIYDIDKVVGAERWKHPDAHDHIRIIVATPSYEMIEYIVQMPDPNSRIECLETLRGLGIQAPDDMDIAYVKE